MCNNWPDFPIGMTRATGGLIGDTVIICGGYDGLWNVDTGGYSVSKCYSLTSEKVTLVTHMTIGRYGAASIVVSDNTLWVTGGFNNYQSFSCGCGGYLASTEYVTVTGTMLGPDMPIGLTYHAMVAINSTFSMVIGGEALIAYIGDYSASTFFYDHNEDEWINGPSLMQARNFHATGIVTDEVTNDQFVAVTGGFGSVSLNSMDFTEILQDGEWVPGKINNTVICANLILDLFFEVS